MSRADGNSNPFEGRPMGPIELHFSLGNGANGRGRNARKAARPRTLCSHATRMFSISHLPASLLATCGLTPPQKPF